ncbi:MAG: helix-turn-helix transcriptional regulator [Clostridia bacterium]|nr:helix-turn-helix transcriptional regulator [Clostridia bacterium]
MAVQYNKLLKRLVDLKMSNAELIKRAGISANIMTKIRKDAYISMESLEKICRALDCSVDEIMIFVEDGNDSCN